MKLYEGVMEYSLNQYGRRHLFTKIFSDFKESIFLNNIHSVIIIIIITLYRIFYTFIVQRYVFLT